MPRESSAGVGDKRRRKARALRETAVAREPPSRGDRTIYAMAIGKIFGRENLWALVSRWEDRDRPWHIACVPGGSRSSSGSARGRIARANRGPSMSHREPMNETLVDESTDE